MTRPERWWLWAWLGAPEVLRRVLEAPTDPVPFTLRHCAESLLGVGEAPPRLPRPGVPPDPKLAPGEPTAAAAATLTRLEHVGALDPAIPAWMGWARAFRALQHTPDDRDLDAIWGLPDAISPDGASLAVPELAELHAHLRGSVPFRELWKGWLADARWRAKLRRGHFVCAGSWRRTWAELLEDLARPLGSALAPTLADDGTAVLGEHATPGAVQRLAVALVLRRALIYQPGRAEPGLASFVEAFDRASRVQKRPSRDEVRHLTRTVLDRFAKDGVTLLELRPTLERTAAELNNKLRQIALGWLDHLADCPENGLTPVLLGVVPSLFKQEGKGSMSPEERTQIWREQVQQLLGLLEAEPVYRWLVVGLDAAGEERGCPPALLAPAVAELHAWNRGAGPASRRPGPRFPASLWEELRARTRGGADQTWAWWCAEACRGYPPGWPRLGLTVHAGEDFADPLTGLRAIWETVHQLQLGCGDRIGHALAAALAPDLLGEWLRAAERQGRARRLADLRRVPTPAGWDRAGAEEARGPDETLALRKPRAEHVLDLCWIAMQMAQPARSAALAELGGPLSRLWPGREFTDVLARTLDPARPGELRMPGVLYIQPDPDPLHEWVLIDQTYRETFEALRQQVLRLLVERCLVVETCPTSNRVVAGLKQVPAGVLVGVHGLRVVVCSDDPGLFGRWTRAELEEVAAARRQQLVENGRRFAFTRRD